MVAKRNTARTRAILAFAERFQLALAERWPEKVGKKGALWALHKASGLSPDQLQRWKDGERGYSFVPDDLFAAADALRVECRWLAIGQGPKRRGSTRTSIEDAYPNRAAAIAFARACGYRETAIRHVQQAEPAGAARFSPETWLNLIRAQDALTQQG